MKRTPLRRRAQLCARKPLRRTTPLERTPSLAATDSQRAAVVRRPCIVCGSTTGSDPAHLLSGRRRFGGAVVPACSLDGMSSRGEVRSGGGRAHAIGTAVPRSAGSSPEQGLSQCRMRVPLFSEGGSLAYGDEQVARSRAA